MKLGLLIVQALPSPGVPCEVASELLRGRSTFLTCAMAEQLFGCRRGRNRAAVMSTEE